MHGAEGGGGEGRRRGGGGDLQTSGQGRHTYTTLNGYLLSLPPHGLYILSLSRVQRHSLSSKSIHLHPSRPLQYHTVSCSAPLTRSCAPRDGVPRKHSLLARHCVRSLERRCDAMSPSLASSQGPTRTSRSRIGTLRAAVSR